MLAMTPPKTPFKVSTLSPSGFNTSSSTSSFFMPSSPLNPYSHSDSDHLKPQAQRADHPRRAAYKSRSRAYRTAHTAGPSSEPPFNALMRDRVTAKAFARLNADRKRTRQRAAGSSHNDGDMDEDEDDDEDALDDVLFRRLFHAEQKKMKHAYEYSFQRQVGSSFDPDMEDPAEWENEPMYDASYEDGDDDDYFAEMAAQMEEQAIEIGAPHSSQTQATPSQTALPLPVTPGQPALQPVLSSVSDRRNQFLNELLQSPCPRCNNPSLPLAISNQFPEAVSCPSCNVCFPLSEIASSWLNDHPNNCANHHPLWNVEDTNSSYVLFACSSTDCFWLESGPIVS